MLEWPSSYCQSLYRATIKFFTHLFFSSFLTLEETPLLRNHWGCFLKVPVWQGDRGHHSVFSLIWTDFAKLKRGFSAPFPKTLTAPAPYPATPHHFSHAHGALPCSVLRSPTTTLLCDTSSIVRGRQRTGSLGVGRACLKVSSISLCVMDVARRPCRLKMQHIGLPNADFIFFFQVPTSHCTCTHDPIYLL